MSKSIEEFKPIYRLFPSSLKSRFESEELDVKCFFLVSDLAYEVIKRNGSPRSVKKHSVSVKKFFMLVFYAACGVTVAPTDVAWDDTVAEAVQSISN